MKYVYVVLFAFASGSFSLIAGDSNGTGGKQPVYYNHLKPLPHPDPAAANRSDTVPRNIAFDGFFPSVALGTPGSLPLYSRENGQYVYRGCFMPYRFNRDYVGTTTTDATTSLANDEHASESSADGSQSDEYAEDEEESANQSRVSKKKDGLGFTFKVPKATDCYGWKWTLVNQIAGTVNAINKLKDPMQVVHEKGFAIGKTLKNSRVINPVKRIIFLLAVQPTQKARNALIVKCKGFYKKNSEQREILTKLQTFSDSFKEKNPFGLLFDKVKGLPIQPASENTFDDYFEPVMEEIKEERL